MTGSSGISTMLSLVGGMAWLVTEAEVEVEFAFDILQERDVSF